MDILNQNVGEQDSLIANKSRFGIGHRLILSFAVIAAVTVFVSLFSWYNLSNLGKTQSRMALTSLPSATIALRLSNEASQLAMAAPQLNLVTTNEQRQVKLAELKQIVALAEKLLARIPAEMAEGEHIPAIATILTNLNPLFRKLDQSVQNRLAYRQRLAQLNSKVIDIRENINDGVKPLLFPLNIKMMENDMEPVDGGGISILKMQGGLLDFKASGYLLTGLMMEGRLAASKKEVDRLEGQFVSSLGTMASPLSKIGKSENSDKLSAVFEELLNIGSKGEANDHIFKLRRAELATDTEAKKILSEIELLAASLSQTSKDYVEKIESSLEGEAIQNVKNTSKSQMILLACTVFALIVVILIGWLYVGRNIIRRLLDLVASTNLLASGNLTADIKSHGDDELGQMGKALTILKTVSQDAENLKAQQEDDRLKSIEEKRSLMLEMANSFDQSVRQSLNVLTDNVKLMGHQSNTMQGLAHATKADAANVSEATGIMTTDITTVASATEQLSSSISEISKQVGLSSDVSQQAVQRAENLNGNIGRLEDGSQKIESVIGLINSIAEQTSLLALNATIEAARAGDAGKGFAIVASEVKNLANQTTSATEQIDTLIKDIQAEIISAVNSASHIDQVIGRIDEITTGISAAVEQQGAATEEISRTVSQSATRCTQIAEQVEDISSAISETGDAIETVLGGVSKIDTQNKLLVTDVDQFLDTIRAQ